MDENRRSDGYYELIQWRTLGCLIPVAFMLGLLYGLPYLIFD